LAQAATPSANRSDGDKSSQFNRRQVLPKLTPYEFTGRLSNEARSSFDILYKLHAYHKDFGGDRQGGGKLEAEIALSNKNFSSYQVPFVIYALDDTVDNVFLFQTNFSRTNLKQF